MRNLRKKTIVRIKKLAALSLGIGGFTGVYMPVNYFNSTREAHYHAYTDWELNIPFWPAMILFYFSAYIVPFLPLYFHRLNELKILAKTTILSSLIGGVFFLLFPTILGWDRSVEDVGIWKPFFDFLWKADYPHNLAPSLHVVMAHLLVIPTLPKITNRLYKGLCVFWFWAISLSILFVHQHHLLDLVTGLILAEVCYRFYYKPRLEDLKSLPAKELRERNLPPQDEAA